MYGAGGMAGRIISAALGSSAAYSVIIVVVMVVAFIVFLILLVVFLVFFVMMSVIIEVIAVVMFHTPVCAYGAASSCAHCHECYDDHA